MQMQLNIDDDDAYRGELFDFFIGGAQRGQTNLLGELGKAGIGQQWHMTQELMDGIAVMRNNKKRRLKMC